MAVSTGNQYLWSFLRWARKNPYKTIEAGMTWDDMDAMAQLFARVNETDAGTATETDPLSYGVDVDIPGKTTDNDDGAGISFTTPTDALCSQSRYPESHIFTAAGAPI